MYEKEQQIGALCERNDKVMAFIKIDNVEKPSKASNSGADGKTPPELSHMGAASYLLVASRIRQRVADGKCVNLAKAERIEEKLNRIVELYIGSEFSENEAMGSLFELERVLESTVFGSRIVGLEPWEQAIYEIITSVKDQEVEGASVELVHLFCDGLKEKCTVDWFKKESTAASMRNYVKRMLKGLGFTGVDFKEIMGGIIRQCEYWEGRP